MTNGYNAEYGRAAGGVIDVNIKSGTNQIHGVGFEILQNTVLDANRWENNLAGTPRNPFKQNQFGGAIGGPIIKDRLFIFGDYQGTKIRTAGGVRSRTSAMAVSTPFRRQRCVKAIFPTCSENPLETMLPLA